MNKKYSFALSRLLLAGTVIAVYWGFHSGRMVWRDNSVHLASFQIPADGPTAAVHPEVLNLQASFTKVAEIVKPAVVSITTVHTDTKRQSPQFFFGDPLEQFFDQFMGPGGNAPYGRQRPTPRQSPKFKMEGMGSGVIIDPAGLVLTNEHVVHEADEIKVTLYDKDGVKTDYVGKVVGKDARTDIAVVRIKVGHKLPFAALGNSEKVEVGDWAIAVGSPFGLAQTFTVGVISAARQSLEIEDREYHNLIQTDAAINRGNSGGPLLNIRGEVVGINTAIYAPTGVFAGIGFAVPINQAKAILDELVEKGHVVRGWLGVELSQGMIAPAMVKAFGLPDSKGALVNSVMKNSPADHAGLVRGDVIRSFDGKPVESSEKLQDFVAHTPPKKSVSVEVIRDKQPKTLTLTLGERPESADSGGNQEEEVPSHKERKSERQEWQGAKFVTYTADMADEAQQPQDAKGVLVVDLASGSTAEEIGLAEGDIIRAVNQNPTPDAATFNKVVGSVKLSDGVVLDVLRQGRPIYLSFTKK